MGRPKALLPCPPGGDTFVARCVRALRTGGAAHVLVVGRPEDDALRAELARVDPVPEFVANPTADEGQLSSLVRGITAVEDRGAPAVIVLPVDVPLVKPESVAALLAAYRSERPPIARVTCGGRHGHPVLFDRAVFAELRTADPSRGARAVMRADPARVLDVEVGDHGVLRDVDGPADYEALFGRAP